MIISNSKKYLMTTSNDGCVINVSSEDRTHPNDIFMSRSTLEANVKNGKFVKHQSLKYNDNSVYVLKEDL